MRDWERSHVSDKVGCYMGKLSTKYCLCNNVNKTAKSKILCDDRRNIPYMSSELANKAAK